MKKHLLGVLGATAMITACQGLPGAVTAPTSYFPLIEGGAWTYNVLSDNTVLGQVVETQSLIVTKDGLTTAHLRLAGNLPTGDPKTSTQVDVTLRASSGEIVAIDSNNKETKLFQLPLTIGTSYPSNDATVKVTGNDDVSVPAGAYRNALLLTAEAKDVTSKVWLVENVGVVKLQIAPKKEGSPVFKAELATFKPTP